MPMTKSLAKMKLAKLQKKAVKAATEEPSTKAMKLKVESISSLTKGSRIQHKT